MERQSVLLLIVVSIFGETHFSNIHSVAVSAEKTLEAKRSIELAKIPHNLPLVGNRGIDSRSLSSGLATNDSAESSEDVVSSTFSNSGPGRRSANPTSSVPFRSTPDPDTSRHGRKSPSRRRTPRDLLERSSKLTGAFQEYAQEASMDAADGLPLNYLETGKRAAELGSIITGCEKKCSKASSLAPLAITAGLLSVVGGGVVLSFPVLVKALAVAAAIVGAGTTFWGMKQAMKDRDDSSNASVRLPAEDLDLLPPATYAADIAAARHAPEDGGQWRSSMSDSDSTEGSQTPTRKRRVYPWKPVTNVENAVPLGK